MSSPKVHSSFTVSSGGLCFGDLHNIWEGASVPVQPFQQTEPQRSGTVKVQRIEYNVPAGNGIWNAYELIELERNACSAWFLAHDNVNAGAEIDKILRVAGSPYEDDSGSQWNDSATAAAGVFLINRYDWGHADQRSADVAACEKEITLEMVEEYSAVHIGVVDRDSAKEKVLEWKKDLPSQRRVLFPDGMWLRIPQAEYMFGRFGFDDEQFAARSFLFFSAGTIFTQTSFAGIEQPLRKSETDEERFERRLQEGFDFSGLKDIREWHKTLTRPDAESLMPRPPPDEALLGPYDHEMYLLEKDDLDTILVGTELPTFITKEHLKEYIEPYRDSVLTLLNEMLLSELQHCFASGQMSAEVLFPRYQETTPRKHIDVLCHQHFTGEASAIPPNFDLVRLKDHIRSFFEFCSPSEDFTDKYVADVSEVVLFFATDVLKLSAFWANDNPWSQILPHHIRMVGLEYDKEKLRFSKVFWEGSEEERRTYRVH